MKIAKFLRDREMDYLEWRLSKMKVDFLIDNIYHTTNMEGHVFNIDGHMTNSFAYEAYHARTAV